MLDAFLDGLSWANTRAHRHFLVALAVGIGCGVVAAKNGYEAAAPYAATAGFFVYVAVAIILAIRKRRRDP